MGGAAQAVPPSIWKRNGMMLREILELVAFKVIVLVALFAVLSLPDTW
jgi:hypothetical protein